MRKWKANSYVLSVCLLASEYVRQQQHSAQPRDDSIAPLADAAQPSEPAITTPSLNALACFLSEEIQQPLQQNKTGSIRTGCTTLHNLLRRLEISLSNERDFQQLSWQVVSILTQIQSPDAMCNVVERISECVAPLQSLSGVEQDVDSANSTLARTSLLGVFVRSFLLEVDRLLFDGLSRLYDDVTVYLEHFKEDVANEKQIEQEEAKDELLRSPASQNPWNASRHDKHELRLSPIPGHPSRQSVSSTPLRMDMSEKQVSLIGIRDVNDPGVWSNDQLNYILSDLIRDMDKGQKSQLTGISLPEDERQLLLHSTMDPSDPNVLYARYLSFLYSRDYQGALDSLHQYHDVVTTRSSSSDATSTRGAKKHFRGNGIQYAALNLAGLHILFNHYEAAQESIQEAIRVAQHHGDHICVAFALAWLISIYQKMAKPKEMVVKLIRSCLDRVQESQLPSLQVLLKLMEGESELFRGSVNADLQAAAHHIAAQVPAPRPLHVWSHLEEAMQSVASIATPAVTVMHPNTQSMMARQMHAGSATDASTKSTGMGMDWMESTEAVIDTVWNLSGHVTIFTAVGWTLFGHHTLAQAFRRIHLLCYEDSATTEEIALIVSQLAMASLTQAKGDAPVYEQALNFLVDVADQAERRFLLNDMLYQRNLHRLFFLWALQRGEVTRAQVHIRAILALSPAVKDMPAHLDALLLKAALHAAKKEYSQCFELLEDLEKTCQKHDFAYLHAQVLITISRTRLKASAPHAPFASLTKLLQGIDICTRCHYDLLLAEAHVVMAEMYVAMGKLQEADALMNDQMALVMEHGSINLRGECLLVIAKTRIGSIERFKKGTTESNAMAKKAMKMLMASAGMFELVQNLERLQEICYVQSIVYHHMSMIATKEGTEALSFLTSREERATQFLKHTTQLKHGAFFTVESHFDSSRPENIRQVILQRSKELSVCQSVS
ncbi:hypothetical protein CCR75_003053 [Bremia lactucae]|uniref:Anaphase-promoting complex subunit 5 n=1 Tax=Bremia lactucae TaxID=4779 RepID=A0A976IM11_BRELC|nr:hypothetical protein CCR75_003053 [Bremia lactucae]